MVLNVTNPHRPELGVLDLSGPAAKLQQALEQFQGLGLYARIEPDSERTNDTKEVSA